MSHNSTPHMHSKRTPALSAANTPHNVHMASSSHSGSSPAHSQQHQSRMVMNSERTVSDNGVTNARQLLNAYIYEFLVKNTLPETAKMFVVESDVPTVANGSAKTSPLMRSRQDQGNNSGDSAQDASARFAEIHNVPRLALSMEAPQGFLLEWWKVFWDVYQAKNDRSSATAVADQYYKMQMMAQKQPLDPFGMSLPIQQRPGPGQGQGQGPVPAQVHAGMGVAGASVGHPLQAQNGVQQQGLQGPQISGPPLSQQQQQQLQQQLQRQGPGQGQQPPPHMDPRQQRYMMQMMMKQQQFQQQQQMQQQKQHQQLQNQVQNPNSFQPQGSQAQQGPPPPPPPPPPHNIPQQQQQQQQQQHIQMQQQQQTPHQTPQQLPQQVPLQTPPVNQMARQPPQQQQPHPHPQPQNIQGMGQPMNNMGMNMKQQQQQQMFMHQQQQGLSQTQNRIQQQAQTQMNNLRQQATVAHSQGHGPSAAGRSPVISNGQGINPGHPRQLPPQNIGGMPAPFQANMANGGAMSPSFVTGNVPGSNPNMQLNNMAMNQAVQPGRNSNALQDYQMQLMVLERQNKKRLDIARSNGTSESPGPMSQLQHPSQMSPHQQMSAPPISSPQLTNQASPGASGPKQKKEPAKRGRKPSVPNSAITPQSAGTDIGGVTNGRSTTSGSSKRERNAPLTPAADSESVKKKKKVSGGDSPKKASKPAGKKEKATPKVKHAEEPNADMEGVGGSDQAYSNSDLEKMPPPNGAFFQPSLGSVELIGGPGGNGEVNFFNPGGNSSIDDIDFDFNSFLDAGDDGLNDGLSGYNWGNPIEGD